MIEAVRDAAIFTLQLLGILTVCIGWTYLLISIPRLMTRRRALVANYRAGARQARGEKRGPADDPLLTLGDADDAAFHLQQYILVELAPTGAVCAIWYGRHLLPYREGIVSDERAAHLRAEYQERHLHADRKILSVTVRDPLGDRRLVV